ncbi:uncharacterized protein METZ01_LOCUS507075 [marine metagenome]|uniref:Uncharacterized protein n=1 Tax=marine metagenome TaxID=408172 RepID=A0A383EBX4_9ZZZZ
MYHSGKETKGISSDWFEILSGSREGKVREEKGCQQVQILA